MFDFKIYLLYFVFSAEAFSGYRVKRQDSDDDDEESTQKKICAEAGAEAGEWFRLQAGEDKCRDVVSCTASVRVITFSKLQYTDYTLIHVFEYLYIVVTLYFDI